MLNVASVVFNSHADLLSEIEEKFKLFKYILSNSELTTELCRKSRLTKEVRIKKKNKKTEVISPAIHFREENFIGLVQASC